MAYFLVFPAVEVLMYSKMCLGLVRQQRMCLYTGRLDSSGVLFGLDSTGVVYKTFQTKHRYMYPVNLPSVSLL